MVTYSDGIWSVPLSDDHQAYNLIKLRRRHATQSLYRVVVVDTAAFMDCHARAFNGMIVPPADWWRQEDREHLCKYLEPSKTNFPGMPEVSFELPPGGARNARHGFEAAGVASFNYGHHRSRYFEYAGANCFPVEVHVAHAHLLMEHCGCNCCNHLVEDLCPEPLDLLPMPDVSSLQSHTGIAIMF